MRKLIAVGILSLLALASGCASGRTADGRSVYGFLWPVDDAGAGAVADAAGAVGGTVGSVFGPAGAIAGETIAKTAVLGLLALFGYSQGRHRGWDEHAAEAEPRARGRPGNHVPVGADLHGAAQIGLDTTIANTHTVTRAAD